MSSEGKYHIVGHLAVRTLPASFVQPLFSENVDIGNHHAVVAHYIMHKNFQAWFLELSLSAKLIRFQQFETIPSQDDNLFNNIPVQRKNMCQKLASKSIRPYPYDYLR